MLRYNEPRICISNERYQMKTHKKKWLKRGLILVLILAMSLSFVPEQTQAANQTTLKKKLADIESQQSEVSSKISKLKKQKDSALEQKQYYDKQISLLDDEIEIYEDIIKECDNDIETLDAEIADLNDQITVLDVTIQDKEAERQTLYKAFKTRIRVMYEEDLTSYAGILLLSGSISDLMARIEAVSKILSADVSTMNKLEDMSREVKDAKAELDASREKIESDKTAIEEKKAEQEESKQTLDEKRVSLAQKQSEAESLLSEIKTSLSSNQKLLSKLESQEASVEKEIQAAAKETTSPTTTTQKPENAETSETKRTSESSSASLSWPLPGISRISCYYGYRTHPVTGKKNSFHTGIDIPASSGTSIKCAAAGTVTKACYNSAYGNMIVVSHGNGLSTMYAHMKSSALYKVGAQVSKGTTLGYVGTTGLSTGNHLHFSVLVNGNYVNPLNYVSP